MKSVLLRGLQPQPLASYLAALGVLRIAASKRPQIRGAFGAGGFVLEGIGESDLKQLLLDDWEPTPVLTPWNNASGFYASSKGRNAQTAMAAILSAEAPRFRTLVRAIEQVRSLVREAGFTDAPGDEQKARFVAQLRNVLSDEAVAWIDAVAVIDESDARMMPLLGSGGNEGVLDYSGLFLRSIEDVLLGDRERSARLLAAALDAAPTRDLVARPGGQFEPGSAGGFNTGPGFESKDLPNNPWLFLLLVEGTLMWASGLASRQQGLQASYRFAVSPFTVRHRATGYGSAGHRDDDPQRVRAELWVPVWRRAASLAEVRQFIAEGRVEVSAPGRAPKRAEDSLDFADAVASLGVDRGVDAFVRYAFSKRRGESYIALPAGALSVGHRREADLLRQLDRNLDRLDQFFSRFPSEQGAPAQLQSARRAVNDARFDVAARGGPEAMVRLVRAIGALEMLLAKRDPGKEPRLSQPLGGLGPEWVEHCGDSPEVRIAAALASLGAWSGAAPWRAYVAPVEPDNVRRFAPAARTLAWSGSSLAERLTNVLHRRILDARRGARGLSETRSPTWSARVARLEDLAMFLAPDLVDETAIEELLFGFTWVRLHGHGGTGRGDDLLSSAPPLARAYCLLKLLFLPHGFSVAGSDEPILIDPDPNLLPLLRSGRVGEALELAARQLRARALRPRQVAPRASDQSWRDELGLVDAAWGQRLAAALLIPVWESRRLLELALIQDSSDQQNDRTAQETTDAE